MSADPVADRLALMDLFANYARGVDDRDLDLYRSCFAEDVEVVGFGDRTYHGREDWVNYVAGALAAFGQTQHLMGHQHASVDGDRAQARTDVQALHYLLAEPGTTLTLWGTYHTEFHRLGGQWKIKRHQLVTRGTRRQGP